MASRIPLVTLVRQFFEADPAAAVHRLETMKTDEILAVLQFLPTNLTAQIFTQLQARVAAALLERVTEDRLTDLVARIDAQQGALVFMCLSEESRQRFMDHVSENLRNRIRELLIYPPGSAGRIMTTECLAFRTDVKVKEAIQMIRSMVRRDAPVTYTYVVDTQNRLVGVLNMRDLLLAGPDTPLEAVMRKEVFTVDAMMDREEVAHALSVQRYLAAPVVDQDCHLLGVVKTGQLLEQIQEEATEDIQKMVGAGADERVFSSINFSLRKRLPWLFVNLGTAFLAAGVVGLFQNLIARITILAVFLPVVAGQGGNAGAQSLAVVMRGMVMREIPPQKVWRMVIKETSVGLLNGFVIGIVTALVVWIWQGNPYLGVVIGMGMVVNLLAAGFAGAAIPLAMKAMGKDPAQSSSIILTTVTDVVGNFAFLGFACLLQQYLL